MTDKRHPPAATHRAWFTAVMLALPVLFFVVLEGGLRVFGYGDTYPLFIEADGIPGHLTQNDDVAKRYFSGDSAIPTGVRDVFATEKPDGEFRIVVQGGSSAAGYPYYYGGSFPRMLEQRLQQTFPDRPIEVINTSLAAVNSYTLLDFASEIITIEPDLVLIYAGHNEYYGALGVGSAESLGRSRWLVASYLRLRRFRTVQLLRSTLARIAGTLQGRTSGEAPAPTLMARMAREQRIRFGSVLYEQGLDQFRGNLRALLSRYQQAGVPVYISTVASNERDHPPFESSPSEGVDEVAYRASLEQIESMAQSGLREAALVSVDSLIEVDGEDAAAFYLRGRLLDEPGSFELAADAFVRAKDLDQLRFRAPEDANDIIRQVAREYGGRLVDGQGKLRAASPGNIIDGSLILEHLHPNADGYLLLADAFYEALRSDARIGEWTDFVSLETARRERLLTPVDSIFGQYRLSQLMGSWPFKDPSVAPPWTDTLTARTLPESLALKLFRRETSWYDANLQLRGFYMEQGDYHNALKVSLAIIQQYPYLPLGYALAGDVLVRQRRGDEALAYYHAAVEREESAQVRAVIGDVEAALGRHDRAAIAYRRAVELSPTDADVALKLGRSLVFMGDTLAAESVLQELLERVPNEPRATSILNILSNRP